MPDKADAPVQDLMSPTGSTEQAAPAPAAEPPLTRKELQEMLGGIVEPLRKEYAGLRSVNDRRYNELSLRLQQTAAQRQQAGVGDGETEPVGYDVGTDSDKALARVAARELDPYFDYSKVEPILNDPNVAPRYLRLKPDGKTFDWVSIYADAWRDKKAEIANEYLAKQREAQMTEEAQREAQKRQAIISGSDASYPEGVKIPQTKAEARNLSDAELSKAMMAQFEIPDDQVPTLVRESLNKR